MSNVGDINAMANMVAEYQEELEPVANAWEKVQMDYSRLFNSDPELGARVLTDMLSDLYYFDAANSAAKVVLQGYARLLLRKLGSFNPEQRRAHTEQLLSQSRRAAQKES